MDNRQAAVADSISWATGDAPAAHVPSPCTPAVAHNTSLAHGLYQERAAIGLTVD